jgi:antitoxin MazE
MQTQAKINMWGNSLAIRITSAMANTAHLHKGSEVEIEATEEGIMIKPLHKKISLKFSEADLLADLCAENSHDDNGSELLASNISSELDY